MKRFIDLYHPVLDVTCQFPVEGEAMWRERGWVVPSAHKTPAEPVADTDTESVTVITQEIESEED